MFKRKKKKTGCETPEFRRHTAPPPPPIPPVKPEKESVMPKRVNKTFCGTPDRIDAFLELYEDAIKIDGELYWSDSKGVLAVFTTQEYKDYLVGKSNIMPNTKENN